MALIYDQPLPLRLVLGAAYLFVFPIPLWAGFQLETAYHLFKSFNVLFFYAVFPLFTLAVFRVLTTKAYRTPSVMFLLFLIVGFTLAVAGTSLETRHFGVFLLPLFVLATLPDLRQKGDKAAYEVLLLGFLTMMAAVHILWGFLSVDSSTITAFAGGHIDRLQTFSVAFDFNNGAWDLG